VAKKNISEIVLFSKEAIKFSKNAIVLMFRCYGLKCVHPIAVYATSGAASSIAIQKIVVKAITALGKKGQYGMAKIIKHTKKNTKKKKKYLPIIL
jgi:hypothetical protein